MLLVTGGTVNAFDGIVDIVALEGQPAPDGAGGTAGTFLTFDHSIINQAGQTGFFQL